MSKHDQATQLSSQEEVKACVSFLYSCTQSVMCDNSLERKEYICETFNSQWEELFGEKGPFKVEGE